MRRFVVLALCAAAAVAGVCVASAGATTPLERTQARQLKSLKVQRATLRRRVAAAKRAIAASESEVSELTDQLEAATTERDDLATQVPALTQQRDRLLAENAGLKGGVTAGAQTIAAAGDLQQLVNLVLAPAQDAWPCHGDRTITLGYSASFSFSERQSSGTCF